MYKDTLNYSDLIINNRGFYGQYPEANYSICGIFVKYIVDNFGTKAFKKYFLCIDKHLWTNDIFKKDFIDIIDRYKGWLDNQ